MPLWQKVLLAQKGQLLKAASAGRSPEVAAMAAVEFLPEGLRGAMEEFARRPDILEAVYAVVPELQQFPHWTEQFFTEARSQLLTDEELEEIAAREGAEPSAEVVEAVDPLAEESDADPEE